VVCLTEADVREVVGLGVRRSQIRLIPIGVDTSFFKPGPKKRRNIVWVGRFVPEKDVLTLLRAFAGLRSHQINLILVGEGPVRMRAMTLANQLGIAPKVTFLPKATRSDVAKMLAESQIFVLPSVREGMPSSLLEAMACANTIVASNLPMIREVLNDTGFYFTSGDHEALTDALKQALSDDGTSRRLGKEARMMAQKRFTWHIVLKKLEDLYREVVAS
jgi:glycosyltransferase involved in cell wall biosynthesis